MTIGYSSETDAEINVWDNKSAAKWWDVRNQPVGETDSR